MKRSFFKFFIAVFLFVGLLFAYAESQSEIKAIPHTKSTTEDLGVYSYETFTSQNKNYKKLTSLTIPEGYTTLDSNAFTGSSKNFNKYLKEIKLPLSLEKVNKNAFENCVALQKLEFLGCIREFEDQNFKSCTSLKSIYFGEDVRGLKYDMIKGCASLEEVFFNKNMLNYMSADSFEGCVSLKTISLPALNYIPYDHKKERGCFENFTKLENVNIPKLENDIPEKTFKNCYSLKTFHIQKGVHFFLSDAFEGCYNLKEFTIDPENPYLKVEDGIVFSADKKRLLCYPPAKKGEYICPKYIEEAHFSYAYGLTKLTVDSNQGIFSILDNLNNPRQTSLTHIEITNPTKEFYSVDGVVYGKDSWTGRTVLRCFPQGRTGSFTVPDFVEELTSGCFANSNLSEVIVPDSVEVIDLQAFKDCKNLKKVYIGGNVRIIGAFAGCSNLEKIEVSPNNKDFCVVDGDLLSKDMKTLYSCLPAKKGVYKVPQSVEVLQTGCFGGCRNLTEIKFPDGLLHIECDFNDCISLSSLTIPKSVLTIHAPIIDKNKNIKRIVFENPKNWYPLKNVSSFSKEDPNTYYQELKEVYDFSNPEENVNYFNIRYQITEKSDIQKFGTKTKVIIPQRKYN